MSCDRRTLRDHSDRRKQELCQTIFGSLSDLEPARRPISLAQTLARLGRFFYDYDALSTKELKRWPFQFILTNINCRNFMVRGKLLAIENKWGACRVYPHLRESCFAWNEVCRVECVGMFPSNAPVE